MIHRCAQRPSRERLLPRFSAGALPWHNPRRTTACSTVTPGGGPRAGEWGRMSPGPLVVFGRGHCGGRILAEAYHRNDIYMGRLSRKNRDTRGMGLKSSWMIAIAKGAYGYPSAPPEQRKELE